MSIAYKYKRVRMVCLGLIKGCSYCSTIDFSEGYCKECGRPLWKKVGEQCNFVIGYVDNTFKKQGVTGLTFQPSKSSKSYFIKLKKSTSKKIKNLILVPNKNKTKKTYKK